MNSSAKKPSSGMRTVAFLAVCVISSTFAPSVFAQSVFVERYSNATGGSLRGFSGGEEVLLAVGDGGRILRSTDGASWSTATSSVSQTLRGVTQGGGQFIAVGDDGCIVKSRDGVAWTVVTSATTATLNAVEFGGNRYVAVGESGTIVSSVDGVNWTTANSGVTNSLRGVGWMEDRAMFVAAGDRGVILFSRDAVAWTPGISGTQDDILTVTAGGVFFYAGLRDAVCTGTETLPLSRQAGVGSGNFRGIAKQPTPGAYAVAVGDAGVVAATQGRWRQVRSGTTVNLAAAGYARGIFYAVGDRSSIFQGVPFEAAQRVGNTLDVIRNLSTRAQAGNGNNTLISGFVVGGSGTKRLLVRASGPALGTFGITQVVAQPTLTIFDARGQVVTRNTGWGTSGDIDQVRAMAGVTGAFTFPDNSADCAMLVSLSPGAYSAQVSGPTTGFGLVEIYDTEVWPEFSTARMINISSRCFVGKGDATAITGVALPKGRRLLIRAVGPGLQLFGVGGTATDPGLELIQPETGGGTPTHPVVFPARVLATNDNWNSPTTIFAPLQVSAAPPPTVENAMREAGAFPLPENSRDAAMIVTLMNGGTFTVNVTNVNGADGVALVEIYDLGAP